MPTEGSACFACASYARCLATACAPWSMAFVEPRLFSAFSARIAKLKSIPCSQPIWAAKPCNTHFCTSQRVWRDAPLIPTSSYVKADAVLTEVVLKSRLLTALKAFVLAGIVGVVVIFVPVTVTYIVTAMYSPFDGRCYFASPTGMSDAGYIGFLVCFVLGDLAMCTAAFYLFLFPLYHLSNSVSNREHLRALRMAAWHSGVVASASVTATFLTVILFSIFVFLSRSADNRYDYIMTAGFFGSLDTLVTLGFMCAITRAWIPNALRLRWRRLTSSHRKGSTSNLDLHSLLNGGNLVVHRGAGQSETVLSHRDVVNVGMELNAADVLDDTGGGVVSIQATHVIEVDEFDTIFARCFPRAAHAYHRFFAITFRNSRSLLVLLHLLIIVLVAVIPSLVWRGTLPVIVGFVNATAGMVCITFLTVACINVALARRVVATSHFWTRALSALITNACLIAISPAWRTPMFVTTFLIQVSVALGDAFSGAFQQFRTFMLLMQFQLVLALVVLLYFDIMTEELATAVVISPTFDYSLVQLARDLLLGTLFVTLFDLYWSVSRASSSSKRARFAHIHHPVRFVVLPMATEATSSRGFPDAQRPVFLNKRRNGPVNASKVLIRSGFLVRQASEPTNLTADRQKRPSVQLYVGMLALKESDCLAVHLIGLNLVGSSRVFKAMNGRVGTVAEITALFVFDLVLIFSPFYPAVAYVAIPMPLFCAVRSLMFCSKTMLALLVRQRQFVVDLFFLSAWYGFSVAVFQDAQLILSTGLYVFAILELLRDANLRQNSKFSSYAFPSIRMRVCSLLRVQRTQVWLSVEPFFSFCYPDLRNCVEPPGDIGAPLLC